MSGKNSNGLPNLFQSGGVIIAKNTIFENNQRDVLFPRYDNFRNASRFGNCTFITNTILKDASAPLLSHVEMNEIDEVIFVACDFKNTVPNNRYNGSLRGTGILANDSYFRVSYKCAIPIIGHFGSVCPEADRVGCYFEGLYNGVYAAAVAQFKTCEIKFANFNNNIRGITLIGLEGAVVVNNSFNIAAPPLGNFPSTTYGLYTLNSSGYTIQNNDFTTSATGSVYGILTNNGNNNSTTPNNDEIYKNTFSNLYAGCVAFNDNAQIDANLNIADNTGLTYQCNSYTNNALLDIGVTRGPVSSFQGNCGNDASPANNTFSQVKPILGEFWQDNSTGNGVNNYFVNYSYSISTNPIWRTEPTITLGNEGYNVNNTQLSDCQNLGPFDPNISCPINRFKSLTTQGLLADVVTTRQEAILRKQLINNNNTTGLLTAINSNMASGTLKNTLLNASPYLSDEVLRATINRTQQLPLNTLKKVIVANSPVTPQVLADVSLLLTGDTTAMELLVAQMRASELNDNDDDDEGDDEDEITEIIEDIVEAQVGISERRVLEGEIAMLTKEANLMVDEVIRTYIHDSTVVNGKEKIALLLRDEGRIYDKTKLVQTLIDAKLFAEAITVNNELKLLAGGAYLDFCKLNEVIINTKQTVVGFQLLKTDTALRAKTDSVAFAGTGKKECINAQNLLNMLFTGEIPLEMPFFTTSKSATMLVSEENQEQSEQEQPLKEEQFVVVYPNPAQNILTIELLLAEKESVVVQLYNMLGEQVLTTSITQNKSTINVKDLPAGTYFLHINASFRNQTVKKVVIYPNQIALRVLFSFFFSTPALKNLVVTRYDTIFCFVVKKNNFA